MLHIYIYDISNLRVNNYESCSQFCAIVITIITILTFIITKGLVIGLYWKRWVITFNMLDFHFSESIFLKKQSNTSPNKCWPMNKLRFLHKLYSQCKKIIKKLCLLPRYFREGVTEIPRKCSLCRPCGYLFYFVITFPCRSGITFLFRDVLYLVSCRVPQFDICP